MLEKLIGKMMGYKPGDFRSRKIVATLYGIIAGLVAGVFIGIWHCN